MRTAPTSGGTRVAAVMAAYNRTELTLACLRSLGAQQVPGVALDVFVLDDASSDGTSEAVAEQFPEVTVLHGDGELYWNGGMRRAFAAAIAMGDLDYGLRARAAGCSVWVAPATVGTCASHPKRRTDEQPLGEELRRIWSLKQLKPGPWAVYSRRWAGRFWPMYWLSPYVRGGLRLVLQRIPPARRGAV